MWDTESEEREMEGSKRGQRKNEEEREKGGIKRGKRDRDRHQEVKEKEWTERGGGD